MKINLPVMQHPTYPLVLPVSKKTVAFRPFLAKEEFILLTALRGGDEQEMFHAVKQIITNCLVHDIDLGRSAMPDIEYLFMHIRAKTVGEEIPLRYQCHNVVNGKTCNSVIDVTIDVNDVKVDVPEGHSNIIMLDDEVGIQMRYPQLDMFGMANDNTVDAIFQLICKCIDKIFKGDEVWENIPYPEMRKFVDNMTQTNFAKVKAFFDDMPELKHTMVIECPQCKTVDKMDIKGLESFFGSWLATAT